MSKFELKLPRMGESVAEATLTSWLKEVGDTITLDEPVLEIATDKVDSEVPSEVEGVLVEKLFKVDDVIKVGETIAIIEVNGSVQQETKPEVVMERRAVAVPETDSASDPERTSAQLADGIEKVKEAVVAPQAENQTSDRFYSPLVRNIAKEEGIALAELDTITGTGKEGRVTKNDILDYVASGKTGPRATKEQPETFAPVTAVTQAAKPEVEKQRVATVSVSGNDEVIEMGRMGKLIAQHMVASVSTSAHVQSFIEVDVTKVVQWRNRVKDGFEKREGEKLTFTPVFMEAVATALKKYPMMNISIDGDKIIKKKNINIGMAAALPDGNLIVPVIKNADQLNMVGMAKVVNDLAERARKNQLKPDEVKDGTYTVTNVGTFGSVFGTPIINQPQVGILALGAIRKIPSVIETSEGDFIGIRSKMFLSHSYDHRVVNGALGSMFAKAVADYLEAWDVNREI
jgi:2-oxoglutarate dehydrogenase E2 component (dihydrolipoamide succinyltransferase)